MELERQTLSIMKACEVVGVSRRTIYNWMAGGKIEYVRTAGGSVRIFADSLWRSPGARPRDSAACRNRRFSINMNRLSYSVAIFSSGALWISRRNFAASSTG